MRHPTAGIPLDWLPETTMDLAATCLDLLRRLPPSLRSRAT